MPNRFSGTLRDARATAIVDAIDAGAAAGKIEFYTSPQPAVGGDAITTQTLLATTDFSDPCGTVTGGVLTFNAISDDVSADADGTIAWARVSDSDDTYVMDLECGIAGSGAAIIFNTVIVKTGGVVRMLSLEITEGNS